MMRKIKSYSKWVFIVGLVLSSTNLLQAISWNGNISGTYTAASITIDGPCTLTGNVTVSTSSNNVAITVTTPQGRITSAGGYTMTLDARPGTTITFDLTGSYDLELFGGTGTNFFNIYQTNAGTAGQGGAVYFKLKGGRMIRFRGGDDNCGVRYYNLLDQESLGDSVGVYFQYDSASPANANAVISLEDSSLFTFMATTALASSTKEGGIGIIPAINSSYSGSLLLNIQDRAGFVLAGHLYSGGVVDLATPAGKRVNMLLVNSGTTYKQRFMVINGNKVLSQLFSDPTRTREAVTGVQHGFILGTNSELRLENGTYLDYIGTTSNIDPLISAANVLQGRTASSILKQRNASALTVDGIDATGSVSARIVMHDESGIFLRSACDASGTWTFHGNPGSYIVGESAPTDVGLVFTITPTWQPAGAGNIVFEVEAALDILGKAVDGASHLNTINVLSREVGQFGGKLEMEGTLNVFPAFTFAASTEYADTFAQYAKACIFVNDQINMHGAIIRHDDFVHTVNATNTPTVSEPTYIGGDTFVLTYSDNRPTWVLFNSELRLHTSAAFTGVDLLITPTIVDTSCTSSMRFYANGRKLDRGTGRALVLGTTQGSYAYDHATVVDSASYLDILQKYNTGTVDYHDLNLTVTTNDHNWISQIPVAADYSTQYSVHTLFLGNESNIQIGSQSTTGGVALRTYPTLNIGTSATSPVDGNFFSFMSQGGAVGQPELSGTTGEGGIFVDHRGTLNIASTSRSNFGCMVVKGSWDATINLPKSRAFFNDRVGITFWDLDLSITQTIIVAGQVGTSTLSDYTLDWMATKKDYDGGFVPFDPTGTLEGTINHHTLYHIPVIQGQVDEFQVKRSRLGDQVHLLVDGGVIRDLVFLSGYDSSEAQTGLVVVQNDGEVGIGDNSTRRDTREANVVLGINGVTIGAEGNGTIHINTDVTINNVCPILAGPDFGLTSTQALYITSDDPHFIRIKKGGVLDLTSFTTTNKQLVFTGKVQLILEPGAEVVLSSAAATTGGTIFFSGNSQLTFEPLIDIGLAAGTSVASTDDFRAKLIGKGSFIFDENSSMRVFKDAYAGIESDATYGTSLYFKFNDNAQLFVGDSGMYGGALQIGNTSDLDTTITCTLELNGPSVLWQVGSQGFIGFAAGIVDKREAEPNNWSIGSLYGVKSITLNILEGILKHDRIVAGSSSEASLFVVGPADHYDGSVPTTTNISMLGGGNIYRIASGVTTVHPTVLTTASSSVGLLASGYLLLDSNEDDYVTAFDASGTPLNFFNMIRTKNANPEQTDCMAGPRANLTHINGYDYMGFLDGTTIRRSTVNTIIDSWGAPVPHSHALNVGAVAFGIDPTSGVINNVSDIIY